MRYLRIESRDAFYDKPGATAKREKRIATFSRDPWDNGAKNILTVSTLPGKSAPIHQASCFWCGTKRSIDEFVKVRHKNAFTMHWVCTTKIMEETETNNICIHCLCVLFDNWLGLYGKSQLDTLYMLCAFSNLYYDKKLAEDILNDRDPRFYDDKSITKDVHFVDLYTRKFIEQLDSPTSFWDESCSPFELIKEIDKLNARIKKLDETEEDRDNYNIIWGMYHYDPFEKDDPKDRPMLRASLVTMIDDAMSGDYVRMKAALEIVRSYYRAEKLGEALAELQTNNENIANHAVAIQKLTETKNKETAMITQFSKDHGFASKYEIAKSRGSGTLSAVIRDMKEAHYDFGAVNKYDIETSAAIKQVSDISAESIFKQVSLTSAEYADMVREQADEIKRLTSELRSKEEELRLFKEKELKQELLEELKQQLIEKNIPTANVDEMIEKEYYKNRVLPPL